MTLDEFFAEAERLNLRVLGTPEETRAALDLKDAEIAALRAEVAGLREDAERYRHMRNNSQFQSRNGPGLYWYLPRYGQGDEGEQLDAAIDATIDAARKGEATTPPPSLSPRS